MVPFGKVVRPSGDVNSATPLSAFWMLMQYDQLGLCCHDISAWVQILPQIFSSQVLCHTNEQVTILQEPIALPTELFPRPIFSFWPFGFPHSVLPSILFPFLPPSLKAYQDFDWHHININWEKTDFFTIVIYIKIVCLVIALFSVNNNLKFHV